MSRFGNKVMYSGQVHNSVFYEIASNCNSDNTIIEFEYDKKNGLLYLHFYAKTAWFETPNYYSENIFNKLTRYWKRFRTSVELLFTGYLESTEIFCFENSSHVADIIGALKEGKTFVENFKKQEEGGNNEIYRTNPRCNNKKSRRAFSQNK